MQLVLLVKCPDALHNVTFRKLCFRLQACANLNRNVQWLTAYFKRTSIQFPHTQCLKMATEPAYEKLCFKEKKKDLNEVQEMWTTRDTLLPETFWLSSEVRIVKCSHVGLLLYFRSITDATGFIATPLTLVQQQKTQSSLTRHAKCKQWSAARQTNITTVETDNFFYAAYG
jgi:hypothetical protein